MMNEKHIIAELERIIAKAPPSEYKLSLERSFWHARGFCKKETNPKVRMEALLGLLAHYTGEQYENITR